MSTENVTYTSAAADDDYAGSYETTEGRVFTVTGGDWDTVSAAPAG